MPIDHVECSLICDGYMVEADAHYLAIFSVCPVDCCEFLPSSGTESDPYIAELGDQRPRNPRQVAIRSEVWEDVVDDQAGSGQSGQRPGNEEV